MSILKIITKHNYHFSLISIAFLALIIFNFSFQNTYYKYLKKSSIIQFSTTQDSAEEINEVEEDTLEDLNDSFEKQKNNCHHQASSNLFCQIFPFVFYLENKYTEIQNPPPEELLYF